ncbi:MAG: ABC transporter permease [Lachnospiraceae bacterium]|nr:ABC transporter permease [Lachnospiraceae bacterium]
MDRNKRKPVDYLIIVFSPILLLFIWQFVSEGGLVNTAFLPSPVKVLQTFTGMLSNGRFHEHFSASIVRVSIGFCIGTVSGITIGILSGLFKKVDDVLTVLFSVLRSIPTIGLIPLIILWLGIGEISKVVIIAIGSFWSILLNTQRGISGTDVKLLEVARILQKDKLTVLGRIILPASLPSIITGIRLGISGAWRSVIAAEMIASMRGIGYMIQYAREMSQPAVMFVGLFTLGIIGLALDLIVKLLEKKLIFWS